METAFQVAREENEKKKWKYSMLMKLVPGMVVFLKLEMDCPILHDDETTEVTFPERC